MRTIAVTNQKGGSGKTTTAVNLAAALAESGRKVLIIDLDPQASASAWLGVPDGGKGLFELLIGNGDIVDLVRNTAFSGVSLVPGSNWLVGVEKAMAGEVGAETVLRKAIQALPKNRWDIVLLDCPPSLGLMVVSALVAAQEVVVPVEAHVMALNGLANLLQTVERVKERLNPVLTISTILPCRVDARKNLSKEVVKRLRSRFGRLVPPTVIRENVRLAEAPSFEQPITVYSSESSGAVDYRAAAGELLKRGKERARAQ
jgi:chromosome partitioning protein